MLRLGILLTRGLAPATLCTLALAACGSNPATTAQTTTTRSRASTHRDTHTLYVFSSLPRSGPQKADTLQIEQGIRFALSQAHYRVGAYSIKYRALSDSQRVRSRRGKSVVTSSADATVQNAEAAARNPQTVAYIGDLDSGDTELSLPILNQAGIAQITPGSGYPGLTDSVPGVTPLGEPDKYYPQGRPSLLRLVPNDIVQAAAAIYWLKKETSCHSLAAASFDGAPESAALVAAIKNTAKLYKLTFVGANPGHNSKTYESYAHTLAAQHGVDCFMLAGRVTRAAVTFTNYLKAQLPVGSVILGSDGFCNPRWTDQGRGGVAATVAGSLYCMTPVESLARYLGGKRFSTQYRRVHGGAPTVYTYYGYLATRLVLKAIGEPGTEPGIRKQVMYNLVNNVASVVVETYEFDADGDLESPTANIYQLDRVVDGKPKAYKVLNPSPLLTSAS